jgi:predicted RNA-binding Zn-ribbon protein involved in translation (DUF1610 family)
MPELHVQTNALKIVNKGGGYKGKSKYEIHEEEITLPGSDGKPIKRMEKVLERKRYEEKTTGSDYIVFNCPNCGARNKRCAYDAKVQDKGSVLEFRCHKCRYLVDVKRPINIITTDEAIIYNPTGLVGLDGKEIKS